MNASELIEDAERRAGCRWDDESNPNALFMLLGAVARETGVSRFSAKDDLAVGIVLADEAQNGAQRRKNDAMLPNLLLAGMSPDAIHALVNGKKQNGN